ncbi:hypothetical protein CRN36_10080 [Vibrio vulnificus]|nr:hypothetical protein CRN36_10080 [Vibrio vulnificus]
MLSRTQLQPFATVEKGLAKSYLKGIGKGCIKCLAKALIKLLFMGSPSRKIQKNAEVSKVHFEQTRL